MTIKPEVFRQENQVTHFHPLRGQRWRCLAQAGYFFVFHRHNDTMISDE
jgi:hypothetical protein